MVSAFDSTAYEGVKLQRSIAVLDNSSLVKNPIFLDIIHITSDKVHTVDIPYYFLGNVLSTSIPLATKESLPKLGTKNGYQHLWVEGEVQADDHFFSFSLKNKDRIYTFHSTTIPNSTTIYFTRIGASDPKFNLRRDAGILFRENNVKKHTFLSVIEAHGQIDYNTEFVKGNPGEVQKVSMAMSNENYLLLHIELNKSSILFAFSKSNQDKNAVHTLNFKDQSIQWTGVYTFSKI